MVQAGRRRGRRRRASGRARNRQGDGRGAGAGLRRAVGDRGQSRRYGRRRALCSAPSAMATARPSRAKGQDRCCPPSRVEGRAPWPRTRWLQTAGRAGRAQGARTRAESAARRVSDDEMPPRPPPASVSPRPGSSAKAVKGSGRRGQVLKHDVPRTGGGKRCWRASGSRSRAPAPRAPVAPGR